MVAVREVGRRCCDGRDGDCLYRRMLEWSTTVLFLRRHVEFDCHVCFHTVASGIPVDVSLVPTPDRDQTRLDSMLFYPSIHTIYRSR
jgi:hypothetical protein